MSPKQGLIQLSRYRVRVAQAAMSNRTRVQIECPQIIQKLFSILTTEDEELGTDHRHGMPTTTFGTGTIDHDAGPLSRY
jgi:hypothetical protein